ncbi:MAG: aminopeptidase [Gammaproteobacteria bacterium]|nr:aminopeptidase [Gammaproteobacteria bacterium]
MFDYPLPYWLISLVATLLSLAGCGSVSYYVQSLNGQLELLANREAISTVIDDPDTPGELKQQLELVLQMRQFASNELSLPDNGSYKNYADLNREYVVWNVFAAPEFSLEPVTWCYLVVGCLSYRGYFSEDSADEYAESLRKQGYDVFVGGVTAYSTLGWFDDPVLNTMLQWSDTRIAKVIFHELAHQKLYIRDDTAFNEAFADTVAQEGVCRWLEAHGTANIQHHFHLEEVREAQFVTLVLKIRTRLDALYSSERLPVEKRAMKATIFDDMRTDYVKLKSRWNGYDAYDSWFASDLNNAKLAAVATYREYIPAFQTMLEEASENLETFYQRAAALGALSEGERDAKLNRMLARSLHRAAPHRPHTSSASAQSCYPCTDGSCLEVSAPRTYG